MGTKAVRISEENIEFIKSKSKDNESFDDTLSRVIGRSTQKRIRQLKTIEDLNDWVECIIWDNFKFKKPSFKKVIKLVKQDNAYPKYQKKYPQINSKTKNGQTRLAHFIKTKITRTDYSEKRKVYMQTCNIRTNPFSGQRHNIYSGRDFIH